MIVRLFFNNRLEAGQIICLDEKQSHYLGNVLRLRTGDVFYVFDGQTGEYEAQITEFAKHGATAVIGSKTKEMSLSPDIWLLFAPLKKDKTDMVIQKATELGVRKIIPVRTAFTNAEKVRIERFTAQAVEAAEQCRRLDVPVIEDVQLLPELLKNWDVSRTLLFLDEKGRGRKIIDALSGQNKAAVLIGPEGGFRSDEAQMLEELPFVKSVSLGQRILRAETAAVAALACWQAVNGDW